MELDYLHLKYFHRFVVALLFVPAVNIVVDYYSKVSALLAAMLQADLPRAGER